MYDHRRRLAYQRGLRRGGDPEKGAHVVFQLKANQPKLLAGAKRLDWSGAAVTEVAWRDAEHGRREQRIVRSIDLSTAAGAALLKAFPGAAQAFRIERVRDDGTSAPRTWSYHLTSLTTDQADARRLGEIVRAHWLIENGSHLIRDVAYGEDRCRCRTGHLPEVLAITRSIAIAYAARHDLPHAEVHRALSTDLRALSNLLGVWIAPGDPPTQANAA